uniref:Uncharacterized protein n=1 Tax=Pseudonaja textilis TaxID=8673 RepID=A0A670ZPA7_PSETE
MEILRHSSHSFSQRCFFNWTFLFFFEVHILDREDCWFERRIEEAIYWLCAATGPSIKLWDLEGKIIVDKLKQKVITMSSKAEPPQCTSLVWSADGQTLFAGYTDHLVHTIATS